MPHFDPLTSSERSERMSRIRNADTKPEMFVRRMVHGMGYRYRLHAPDLPGHPDLVFRSRRKVIFVHGCFWHQHGCRQYRQPRTKRSFWEPKLEGNKKRDQRNRRLSPRAFVFENVKGITRASFANYFQYIILASVAFSGARGLCAN